MSEKYISVWIWLINGIVAVSIVLVVHSFFINPKNSWTLKINQIPNIKQLSFDKDIKIPIKGKDPITRSVSEQKWKILAKYNMNQLNLPNEPEPKVIENNEPEIDTTPPTVEEAFADLKTRIRLNGIFAPYSASLVMEQTGLELMVIPYKRSNPNVKDDIQLSSGMTSNDYNVYDDLTEIGLPAKCIFIAANGVIFDYVFTKGKYTETFRLILPIPELVLASYADYLEVYGKDLPDDVMEKNGNGKNSGNRNNPRKNAPKETYIDDKTGTVYMGTNDVEHLSKNLDKELSGLGLKTVKNPKTGKAEGIKVTKMPENSVAKKYGVQKGDTIVSINSHKVTSVSAARAWVNKNPDESSYTVTYIRNGVMQTRTISNPNR